MSFWRSFARSVRSSQSSGGGGELLCSCSSATRKFSTSSTARLAISKEARSKTSASNANAGVGAAEALRNAERSPAERNRAEQSGGGENEPVKTLADILADSIMASGPLSVSTFMRTSLLNPTHGYYTSANDTTSSLRPGRDVLGSRGDFITSPEISQVFGELLAIFFVARWQAVGEPTSTRLIELGPGKGTLLADMIRTYARFLKMLKSLKKVHLVETSPGLIELQHDALSAALTAAGKTLVAPFDDDSPENLSARGENDVEVEWFPRIEAVPIIPSSWTMLTAHEFFDALPIHIFERTASGFAEVLVDVQGRKGGQSGVTVIKSSEITKERIEKAVDSPKSSKFHYVLSPGPTPWSQLLAARNARFDVLQPGQRVEVSPEAWAAARRVGELVAGRASPPTPEEAEKERTGALHRDSTASEGGAALVIDYGDDKAFGRSFRAFKSHNIVDPLEKPGTADLTANVDFLHLKSAILSTDARPLPLMFQSHFLQALGLTQRVEALTKAARTSIVDPSSSSTLAIDGKKRAREIESAAKRLVDPTGMGAQYKVLGVVSDKARKGELINNAEETLGDAEVSKVYPFEM